MQFTILLAYVLFPVLGYEDELSKTKLALV